MNEFCLLEKFKKRKQNLWFSGFETKFVIVLVQTTKSNASTEIWL